MGVRRVGTMHRWGGWDRIDGDDMNSPPWDKCDMDSPHGTKVIKIVLMGQK